ncbi:hypothetical protein [Haloferax sulfurifontis]|uniref:Uncharacterized protein n=2 Tax=Haloferax sulfurifontis TaxID=255616 RepID=M0IIQ2_9EURY|nr:hypothetical protein [Haloferax sulfurifontis]ELZ96630.1 hypothetical protein C441_04659 [Haloferax sulfurifontis ATCC BAA-897]GGC72319.1 hypothetical protein GCM10007209_37810 [Haloferax sulfurifontis]
MSADSTRGAPCANCGDYAPFNVGRAGPRSGKMLCDDCADDSVAYIVDCLDCEWSYTCEEPRYNWYHAKIRVQQEGNTHETEQRVFENESHETVWRNE